MNAEERKYLSRTVAEWVTDFSWEDAPEHVREATQRAFVNSVGTGLAGYHLHDPSLVREWLASEESSGPATLLIDGGKLPTLSAIFANGVAWNARGQEEMHIAGGVHPAEGLLPMALTMAERFHPTGLELLEAFLVGMELTIQLDSFDWLPFPRMIAVETQAVYGALGAAATAARLAKLDVEKTTHALGLVANMAAGEIEPVLVGTGEYHFTVADGNVHGYKAAMLAKFGAEAAPSIFEGAGGFYRVFGDAEAEVSANAPAELMERLGKDWEIPNLIYKPYPVHFFNQPYVDGAITLREKLPVDEVESIELVVPPDAAVTGALNTGPYPNRDPIPGATAFATACGLVRGRCGLADVDEYDAPDVMALVQKTNVTATDEANGGSITVKAGGSEFTFDMPTEGRDFRLPMDRIEAIYLEVMEDVLPADQSRELLDALQGTQRLDDAAELIPRMVKK